MAYRRRGQPRESRLRSASAAFGHQDVAWSSEMSEDDAPRLTEEIFRKQYPAA